MAQEFGNDFSGGLLSWSHGMFGSAINDGASSPDSNTIDFGTVTGLYAGFHLALAAAAGTVTGICALRVKWSRNNSLFESISATDIIAHVAPIASSTVYRMPITFIRARWAKLVLVNSSGVQITTSSAIDYELIFGDQA